MKTSTNMGLNLPEGSDVFDYKKFLADNFQKIDDKIKSNIVEDFVATSGQTVITLANAYVLGTNALSVEIDGVPQVVGVGYTETTTNSITMTEALTTGTRVKVTLRGISAADDARFAQLTTQLAEKMYYVTAVADLKASTKLKAGDTVVTKGYYFANDGGHGIYTIVDDSTLVDNGGTVHTLVSGLKAKLIGNSKFLNVKQFGAKGTNFADETPFIKNALAVLNTSSSDATNSFFGGGTVFFPAGTYIVKETLVVNVNVKLLGENASTWKFYNGRNSASTLRFDFVDKSQAAIKFKGYNPDGTPVTGYYVTTADSYNLKASPDNVAIENMDIESYNGNISLGLDLINAPSSRVHNVSVRNFKYSALINNSWGASIEKLFSLSLYGGVLSYLSNNGISIKDSYITVTGSTIPTADAIVPEIGTGNYPYDTFGVLNVGGTVALSNVIVEQPSVAVKSMNGRINITSLHVEEIKKCVVESYNDITNMTTVFLWNQVDPTPIKMLKATNASNCTVTNASGNISTIISPNDDCVIVTNNCKNVTYDNKKPVITTEQLSDLITFDAGVLVENGTNNANKYVYKSGRTVFVNFKVYTSTATTSGTTIPIGTIPIGYRPNTDISVMTQNSKVSITTAGVISATLTSTTTFAVYGSVSFII